MKRQPKPLETISIAPARTPQEREAEICNAAVDRAYQQICDGTASSQVLVHYLKLADTREKERNDLEKEKLRKEIELLEARTKNYASLEDSQKLLEKAMAAFSEYRGNSSEEDIY